VGSRCAACKISSSVAAEQRRQRTSHNQSQTAVNVQRRRSARAKKRTAHHYVRNQPTAGTVIRACELVATRRWCANKRAVCAAAYARCRRSPCGVAERVNVYVFALAREQNARWRCETRRIGRNKCCNQGSRQCGGM